MIMKVMIIMKMKMIIMIKMVIDKIKNNLIYNNLNQLSYK